MSTSSCSRRQAPETCISAISTGAERQSQAQAIAKHVAETKRQRALIVTDVGLVKAGIAGTIAVVVLDAESAALMGSVWALHFVSSALKVGTLGLSTILTAGAQGAIAYFSTYLVGQVAAEYLVHGKSWGAGGPTRVVGEILESLDRETVLREARREIRARLGMSNAA